MWQVLEKPHKFLSAEAFNLYKNKKWPKKREICWWAHEAGVTFDILVEVHCNEWIIGYRLMLMIHKSL